ncbi:MAG: DUF188 domain-containing protein [Treponema sp.]|nr:DUF188 domain-containing protein [Treponema sp.]
MKLLVDADSCPRQAREMVVRAANRLNLRVIFAANRPIPGIEGENLVMEVCPAGEGSADDRLVELVLPGDLAISRDVPLSKRILEKGGSVIDDRGRLATPENIGELLSVRDFTVGLAETGLFSDRDRARGYGRKQIGNFANSLDRELTRLMKRESPGGTAE